jgi:hypothetical protein
MNTVRLLVILGLALGLCLQLWAKEPAVLAACRARLAGLQGQIPAVTRAAEAAAEQQLAQPEMVIRYAYAWPSQQAFSDEFIARSGALANWQTWPKAQAAATPDLFFYAVRSWEEDGAESRTRLAEAKERGYTVILLGSKQGMPDDLPHDFFLDNGARGGNADETAVNTIANITLGWMWQCEFAAALSRKGQRPGILISVLLPGAREHNANIKPKTLLYPCETAAPAGTLAQAYLGRLAWLFDDLAGERVQGQLANAVELIVAHLREGRRVVTGCMLHAVPMELGHAVKSPFFSMGSPREKEIKEKMTPDDLVVFFGYVGISNPSYDHGAWLKDAGRRVIASFVPDDANPANNADFAVARIDQSWKVGDAEVAIPFPPGKMAPMSVVNQLLLFRMLDEAVVEKMEEGKG